MKYLKGFGLFWWDFIVGDSMVLAGGVLTVVGVGYVLATMRDTGLIELVVPAGVILTLALSLPRRR
ncbi:MAG: hypothetical protein ABIQ47_11520 [Tepidiformaceae bacterium]